VKRQEEARKAIFAMDTAMLRLHLALQEMRIDWTHLGKAARVLDRQWQGIRSDLEVMTKGSAQPRYHKKKYEI